MKYKRPDYLEPGVPVAMTERKMEYPKFDYPISIRENFKRNISHNKPMWATNSATEIHSVNFEHMAVGTPINLVLNSKPEANFDFVDWFNVPMTYGVIAGGSINTPGTHLLEDVTEWEKVVKFPNLNDWDWETKATDFLKNKYNPDTILNMDLHNGCIQRLILLLGGYTEGMMALGQEPEAVKEFFFAYAEHEKRLIDCLGKLYPIDMMTIHDDWGTEQDTFFSPKMMENILFEPTKMIIDHIKSKGYAYMQHSCGNVTRFIPYMIDMGTDVLQIQRRAVDIPKMKELYGDKISFNVGVEDMIRGEIYPKEEMAQLVNNTVEIYAKNGGFVPSISAPNSESFWDISTEMFYCSREYYEKEQ